MSDGRGNDKDSEQSNTHTDYGSSVVGCHLQWGVIFSRVLLGMGDKWQLVSCSYSRVMVELLSTNLGCFCSLNKPELSWFGRQRRGRGSGSRHSADYSWTQLRQ